jgi:nitrate reductase gamma subunit
LRDYLLFAVAPYIAALALLVAGAARYVLWHGWPNPYGASVSRRNGIRFVRAAWRSALIIVALGHVLAFAFPTYLLLWNRQVFRLVVLEVTGVLAGSLASAGVLATLVRLSQARDGDDAASPVQVIARTLVLVGMWSGVGIAAFYRWASSWSEVTLVPYLVSVVRLEPSSALVTRLPVLVKLHVACAFAIVAAFPFTDMALLLVMHVDRLGRRTIAPVLGIARGAGSALGAWITAWLPALLSRVLRNSAEEN